MIRTANNNAESAAVAGPCPAKPGPLYSSMFSDFSQSANEKAGNAQMRSPGFWV
jgi:hypothetical protein